MWTASEREALAVWADDLQVLGDPWGELVTTSLAAETSEDPEHRSQLRARVAELERDVLRPRVQPLLDGFDGIRPTWEHGVMTSLRVSADVKSSEPMFERLAELLRLPAARFLWLLRVNQPAADCWDVAVNDVPRLLLEPDIVARPRVVILGPIMRNVFRVPVAKWFQFDESMHRIVEPGRGLLTLTIERMRVELPWATGDDASRKQAFDPLDARIRLDPSRLSVADRTSLARALWDGNDEIRMAALDSVGALGVEAAPLIPELPWTEYGNLKWEERMLATLAKLAPQPEVVARMVDNFHAEQVGALRWLKAIDELDARSVDRIAAMTHERDALPDWLIAELVEVHRRFRPPPEAPPERRSWLGRMRSWLAR